MSTHCTPVHINLQDADYASRVLALYSSDWTPLQTRSVCGAFTRTATACLFSVLETLLLHCLRALSYSATEKFRMFLAFRRFNE